MTAICVEVQSRIFMQWHILRHITQSVSQLLNYVWLYIQEYPHPHNLTTEINTRIFNLTNDKYVHCYVHFAYPALSKFCSKWFNEYIVKWTYLPISDIVFPEIILGNADRKANPTSENKSNKLRKW